jgi:hypothetical protein
MATLTAIDVLPLVQARAQASTGKSYPGATALYAHAEQAWEDEWITYQALQQQPALRDAANCAWQRRTGPLRAHPHPGESYVNFRERGRPAGQLFTLTQHTDPPP